MREIKFRAWDKDNKRYLEEYDVVRYSDSTVGVHDSSPPFNRYGVVILEQYTGLKDKNGAEIYEGDILRIGSSLIEEVKWVGVGDWVGAKQPMVGFISHETIYRKPIEVIGNIYEHPELLKKEANPEI